MKDEKQIEEMARDIFEPRVAIDGIDIAFAAVHGADRDAENHFMRIARHLYEKCWRKQEWISVEDRLPDDGCTYLVVVKLKYEWEPEWEYHVDAGTRVFCNGYIDGIWDTANDWDEGQECHITHWMPLPEPPKMKGE